MKTNSKTILEKLSHLTSSFREKEFARKYAGDEPALRSELFSADQMQLHGKSLAQSHKLAPGRVPDRLLLRLAENREVLLEVRTLLAEAVKEKRQITPSGEWLLDNFYLIEEQIRTAQRHLPKGYGRELPRLLNGPSPGLPRVYVIALEAISHGDGRVDPEGLSSFVSAYQTVTPLKLGELWAVPIMLRLALIENLRRVASRIAASRFDRSHADYWADQMMEMAEKDPKSLILMIADMARSKQPMVSSFVAEFARRLQGQSSALALPLTWLEQQLSESGLTIEQMIQSENQQQAADQVSVSNSIGSLRFLGAMDWREFVETMSVVEQKLLEDPAGVYGTMDFATRDRYRHVVEKMAKNSRFSESAVADKAIQLARERAATKGSEDREAHVGFYLIDGGLAQLERETKVRLTTFESFQRMMYRRPALFYLGTIMLLTAIVTGSLLLKAYAGGAKDWLLVLTGILSLVCVSQLAVALVNRLTMVLTAPHPLPRMDFSEHIPPELRTLIVVPTMLTSAQNIDDLTEALEVRFLANRDDNLHFSLLTDFRDTQTETLPEDEPLLRLARKRIEDLNKKHNRGKNDTFFLFHRPRRWNPEEQMWMGYERKRGKLGELNSYLRGGSKDGFSIIVGDTAILSNVKYVITLDTDTQLPRDSVWQLVGAMAHPLNRAQYDEDRLLVSKGYGIIQPRVAASLPGMNRSRYARLWGGERGIDPYTRAISDVYQDLFQEGSFIGKGIYDVDALERVLKGRFPENRILSHDLLEGCYARAGLLSDVQVYEEYPTRYSADVSRRHRWIRGDWQLVRWLFPGVPGAGSGAGRRKNPLSVLSRWKLFDNLRRSLVPAASTLLLLLGWTVLSPHWFWTVLVIGIILLSPLIASILELFQKSGDALLRQHLAAAGRSAGRHFAQAVFTVVCLPYETFFSLDAILRTIVRMTITHKHLLQWTPSNDPDRNRRTDLAGFLRSMWIAPFVAASASIYMMLSRPVALTAAAPVLALWFVSPAIAWWTSRPLQRRKANLTLDQTLFLRRISRKTWAFFETFVGAEDNWLPPDNYQEEPIAVIGHRTSPTNMGLTLLANLSAYDFGYLSASQFIERTSKAFRTMESMERFRGHFYNWYDTQSLKPLMPMYISSVDSGNLAGALLTLRPGLLALPDQKIPSPSFFDGLHDTLGVLVDEAKGSAPAQLAQFQTELESASLSPPATLTAARLSLDRLAALSAEVAGSPDIEPESSTKRWADALARQCRDAVDELTFLAPWLVLPGLPDRLREFPEIDEIPTLRELAGIEKKFLPAIERGIGADSPAPDTRRPWLDELRRLVTEASHRAWARIASIERLAGQAGDLSAMDYDFLYDKSRHLLTIGYNVAQRRQDSSYYDLLASEARLSSFVAIAQGQLPQESWFAMGRLLTIAGGEPILMSWGGSMFEYLMPLLVMPTYENTLLDQTYKAAVARQIAYGRELGLPWGMSESCYNSIDVQLICQYRHASSSMPSRQAMIACAPAESDESCVV